MAPMRFQARRSTLALAAAVALLFAVGARSQTALAPVTVSASTLEAQRIWAEHERWLAKASSAAARAA